MRGCRVPFPACPSRHGCLFPASQTLLCLQALLKLLPYLEAFAYHLFVCVCVCVCLHAQLLSRVGLFSSLMGRDFLSQ